MACASAGDVIAAQSLGRRQTWRNASGKHKRGAAAQETMGLAERALARLLATYTAAAAV